MKKSDIQLDDWNRILWGMAPPIFFLEVLFRTLIIYLFLLVMMRLLGKRMNGQLSITEMGVMLTTGAILSPSMQAPDRGIGLGIFAMICALLYQRYTTLWGFKNKTVEMIMQGTTTVLVRDGVLDVSELMGNRISHQQLFSVLRTEKYYNLGQVKRVYLEASGLFSIYPEKEPRPGLSTLPPNVSDTSIHAIQREVTELAVCCNCGKTAEKKTHPGPCPHCQAEDWGTAIL
ncbi:DUF421 domain-containing protein [Siphonobacter sp.]|uniref:DUF421 domain-containing protein n=1 Tax=Siphonobacter sp. TaxID=1869184 RepID=UPI003B3A2DE9